MPPKSHSTISSSPITRSATARGAGSPRARPPRRSRSSPARDLPRASARRARGARRARFDRRRVAARISAATTSTACAARAQRLDLGVVLDDAQRADDRRSPGTNVGVGQRVLQREHEPRPGLVADRGAPRPHRRARRPARPDRRSRPTRTISNTSACGVDPRRFEPRHDELRVAVAREHEHREPLERHRLVAGEVRQIGTDRQQQHVDIELVHAARARVTREE